MAVVELVAGAARAGGEGDSPGATAIEIQISPPSLLFRSVTLLSSSFALPLQLPPVVRPQLSLLASRCEKRNNQAWGNLRCKKKGRQKREAASPSEERILKLD